MSSPKQLYLKALEKGNYSKALSLLKEKRLREPQGLGHPLALAMAYTTRSAKDLMAMLDFFFQEGLKPDWTPYEAAPANGELHTQEITLSKLWGRRHLSLFRDEEMIRDFTQGGLLTWAARLRNDQDRDSVVTYLNQRGVQPTWQTHWSTFHSALSRQDLTLAQTLLTSLPQGYTWEPTALIDAALSSFGYSWGGGGKAEDFAKWQEVQDFLKNTVGDAFFQTHSDAILEHILSKDVDYHLHLWLQTPWAKVQQAPKHWARIWEQEALDSPTLALQWLDNPAFVKAVLKEDFCAFNGERFPGYQYVLRASLRNLSEAESSTEIDALLQKLEAKGATPWIGTHPETVGSSDAEFFMLQHRSPMESFLKRWPVFLNNGGEHPGFAVKTVDQVWQFKDTPEEWNTVNQHGEHLFTRWVALACESREKRLANWIHQKWKSKKSNAPTTGVYQGLSMAEWAAGNEKMFASLGAKAGYPDSLIALNRALENGNDSGVYHLLTCHSHLAKDWQGELLDELMGSNTSLRHSHWVANHFFSHPFKALVEHGWQPTEKQWTWMYTREDPRKKIPSKVENVSAHGYAQAYGLLVSLPDTPMEGLSSAHLQTLITESIGQARGYHPHQSWWNATSFHAHPPIDTLEGVIQLWKQLPDWVQQSLKGTSTPLFHEEQGWKEGEWMMVEGWWKLEALRESSFDTEPNPSRKLRL